MGFDVPKEVTIVEVGPRDGLQNEERVVPTEDKLRLIEALSEAGLKRIEVTSFVHPKWVPQLRDAAEVMKALRRRPGILYSVLVPNQTGFDRALGAGVEEIEVFLSASESHNMLNVNRTIAQSLEGLEPICQAARQSGIIVRASIATSFGCSIEGRVPAEKVIDIAGSLVGMGVEEIAFGDTVGLANPRQAYDLFSRLRDALPGTRLAAHFHDTRGTGLANALAALQAGITIFDSSIGGMGGCPNTPGAAGNVATEDLVNMFEEMGVSTGLSVAKLIECAKLAEGIIGRRLPGQLSKARVCAS
ncbi:MAG: hydroxymethylglutaryl-CoA lyase [Chloroflexi bacterium]|nr:hydroxymethylglutaryl-CoA lyase [Chloroflexota bacterium]